MDQQPALLTAQFVGESLLSLKKQKKLKKKAEMAELRNAQTNFVFC